MEKNVSSPKITVIVPVYNDEKFLDKCLLSLQNQSLDAKKIEILIINDGSTDNSRNIIQKYVDKNRNFRVIDQNNAGLFVSRKVGLENARGDFVGWVDSDDFVEPTMFEKLYNLALSKHSDLVYCNYDFYPKKIGTKEKWFREYKKCKNISFVDRNSQPWNKLVSRELLIKLGIPNAFPKCFDESYIKCLIYSKNPVSIDEQLYHYRVGGDSMSSSYKNVSHYISFVIASKELKNEMADLCMKSDYWNSYFNSRILYYELLTLIISANSNDKKAFNKMRKRYVELNSNQCLRKIMIEDYGLVKYIVMVKVMPLSFLLSRIICKVVFNKQRMS